MRERMIVHPVRLGAIAAIVVVGLPMLAPATSVANMTFERPQALQAIATSAQGTHRSATPSRYADWIGFRGPVVPHGAISVGTMDDGTKAFAMRRGDAERVPASAVRLQGNGPWPTGRVHVKLKPTASRAAAALADEHKIAFVRPLRVSTWMLFDAGAGAALADIADGLRADSRVDVVELDFMRRFDVRDFNENVWYPDQWHLENTGQSVGFPRDPVVGADVKAPAAWLRTFGSPDIVIAVLDSGQDDSHPDFPPGSVVAPFDALNSTLGTAAPDGGDVEAAHGIACAGLAAAPRGGSTGVVGVCPDCLVMPVRIFATDSFGIDTSISDAFVHILENNADIASNSWGFGEAEAPPALVRETLVAFSELGRGGLGGVTIFAIGNTYNVATPFEVALDPNALAVGGTGFDDLRVAYSTFHPQIDVVAPTGHDYDEDAQRYEGAGLITTDRPGFEGYNPALDEQIAVGQVDDNDYTAIMSGTSGACPIAAGVAGLILSLEPSLSYAQVFRLLTDSAEKVGPLAYDDRGHNQEYGFGRVDAERAMILVENNEFCVPSPEICNDGVDNDCDLSIDGEDRDCGFTPPQPDIPYGRVCENDFDCGDGFCAPLNPESFDGLCTTTCFGLTCGDDARCTIFSDGVNDVGLCMRTCDSGCLAGTECADAAGGSVCLQPCDPGSFCPAGLGCFEGNAVCSDDPDEPEPEPLPEPLPDVEPGVQPDVQPDVQPGVQPDVQPDAIEPSVAVPDDEPQGPQPRRRPGRIRIASVSNCAQTGASPSALLMLGIGVVWVTRRRRRFR